MRPVLASIRLLLGIVAVLVSYPLPAGTSDPGLGVRWDQRLVLPGPSSDTFAFPVAARTLGDGTIVIVLRNLDEVSVARRHPSGFFQVVGLDLAQARQVAIDACGDVFVANVFERDDLDDYDYWILKYDGTTGRPLWDSPLIFDGPGDVDDLPAALSLDPAGDVYATILSGESWRTLRIAGTDGGLLWSSTAIPLDFVTSEDAVAGTVVGPLGDLLVGAEVDNEIAAWRLNASTGAFVWGPVVVASPGGRVRGAAIDEQNRFVLAADGTTLLRLDPDDGSLLWRADVRPQGIGTTPTALTIGRVGSVFVAGTRGSGSSSEYFLSSHQITTGEPNWPPIVLASGSEAPVALTAASNGDVLFSASFASSQVGIARIGRDGALVWGIEYSDGVGAPLNGIKSDGTVFEILQRPTPDDNFAYHERSPVHGQVQLTNLFDGVNLRADPSALALLPSGDPVIAFRQRPPLNELRIKRLDRGDGSSVWQVGFPSNSLFGPAALIESDPVGNVVMATLENSTGNLYKLNGATGATVWGPVALGTADITRLAVDGSGNIVLLRETFSPAGANLEKRSGINGAILWGPVPVSSQVASSLHLDGAGDIVLTGSDELSTAADWVVSKYSGATGASLWGPILYDRAGHPDRASFARQLPGGDYVVAGHTRAASNDGDVTLFRYAGATGAVVWGPVFIGGAFNGLSFALDLEVNSIGDVFVAGTISNFPQALMVAKLRLSDGFLLWGPATIPDDRPPTSGVALELDGAGNPMLFATGLAPEGDRDLIRVSWDGGTGALRWGPVFYGGFADDDFWLARRSGSATTVVGTLSVFFGARQTRAVVFSEALEIVNEPGDRLLDCGEAFSEQLEVANANGAVTWELFNGAPDGITLSTSGVLSGTPLEVGVFPVTIQVQDSSAFALRRLTIVVREQEMVPILATPVDDCTWMLSVPGGWSTYSWEPGGETTSTVTVSPLHDTVYGVTVGDGSGCTVRGSILIRARRLIDTDCDAPGLTSISPTSGPASGGAQLTFLGSDFDSGAQARIGTIPAATSFQSSSTLMVTSPALDPGTLNDVVVTNSNMGTAILRDAFFADFLDVDQDHGFHDFVEALVRGQVTAGCGGGNYCPDDAVTREQMAVFLLRSMEGPAYTPPDCVFPPTFNDVPCFSLFAAWIEELADRQVTAGCGNNNYCPNDSVTREQMAVFLLRTLEGPSYTPPDCTTPTFTDVPCSSNFARWIEELVDRGITAGCGGGLYCPLLAVSRGQMAVLLTETFGLP